MKRLGYTQFVAAGGDWGGILVDVMAAGRDAPAELIGIHTTFPGVFPAAIETAIGTGGELPSDLSAAERRAVESLASVYGYAGQAEMAWHPQTLFGLADSPVALAAWLLDHDPISYRTLIAPAFVDGREGGLTRDDILDNVTMFWLTNTGVSASRIYWEHKATCRRRPGRHRSGGRERLPRRRRLRSAELDRAGVPQPRPLQRGRPRRALRRLGAVRSCTPPSSATGSGRSASHDPVRTFAYALVRRRDRVARF